MEAGSSALKSPPKPPSQSGSTPKEHGIEDESEHESNSKATSTTFLPTATSTTVLPKNCLDSEYLWQAGGDWADPNGLLSQGHVLYPVLVDYHAQAEAQAEAQRMLERGI